MILRRLWQMMMCRQEAAVVADCEALLSCATLTPADCGRVASWIAAGRCRAVAVDCTTYDADRMNTLLSAVPVHKIVMCYSPAAARA